MKNQDLSRLAKHWPRGFAGWLESDYAETRDSDQLRCGLPRRVRRTRLLPAKKVKQQAQEVFAQGNITLRQAQEVFAQGNITLRRLTGAAINMLLGRRLTDTESIRAGK
jgi:hypothetical protein